MSRRAPQLAALAGIVAVVAAALMFGASERPGPRAAYAADPADPALILGNDAPCTEPCRRSGVVYGSAASRFDAAAGPQPLRLDLFRSSRTPKADAPVIVLLHGGGFVSGDRTQMRLMAAQLAKAGFLVATIDYRLVPAARNQGAGLVKEDDLIGASADAEEDAERAMRWIKRHATELGATTLPQRYAVGGYSAGAIAALRVALRGGDASTPTSRRWRVGAAFAISGAECGSWTKTIHCKPAYDDRDAPILMFHGEADSVVSFSWARNTCTSAVLQGGGCTAYFYPDQDHFWAAGTMYGGGQGLTKRHPAVTPTIVRFLRPRLAAAR